MPVSLQESAAFTILGDCGRHLSKELEEYCFNKLEQLPLDANFVQKEHFWHKKKQCHDWISWELGSGSKL
jgi:hypothetical protein